MAQWLAVACGGAAGALARWLLASGVNHWAGRAFPWGTLVVNMLGSFAIGGVALWAVQRFDLGPALRLGMLVGFLGALTTFSTFALETVQLGANGLPWRAALYVIASVATCVLAVVAGMQCARQLTT
jgi:CrcB protein